jgi:cobalamin biosynthetic protein CobC
LGPWAVSTPAIIIGEEALSEDDWATTTRHKLKLSSERLDRLLGASGMEVVGGTSLFRLVATDQAEAIYQTLAQCGIMVRQFQYDPKWLRFGLPRSEQDWQRLEVALR